MFGTHTTLRLIVVGLALALSAVAAPAAQAQSVAGSGTYSTPGDGSSAFKVHVYVQSDGSVGGRVSIYHSSTGWVDYRPVDLEVVGNQATVLVIRKGAIGDGGILQHYSWVFVDNGNGSIEPDYFGWLVWGGGVFGSPSPPALYLFPLTSGHLKVTP